MDALFSADELVDVLAQSNEIADSTRRAVGYARDFAIQQGRDYPDPSDCVQACVDLGASLPAVSAAWGYVRDADTGEWLNARVSFVNPAKDDHRHGTVPDQESLLCLTMFSLFTGTTVPFSFEFAKRRPPAAG